MTFEEVIDKLVAPQLAELARQIAELKARIDALERRKR